MLPCHACGVRNHLLHFRTILLRRDDVLFSADREVTGIVAIVRDETARFAEERKLRARLVEVEATTIREGDSR